MKYVVFDYETVVDYDSDNCVKPYSISFYEATDEELAILDKYDKDPTSVEEDEILVGITDRTHCFVGWDCNYRGLVFLSQTSSYRGQQDRNLGQRLLTWNM